MKFDWPQILFILFFGMRLGGALMQHGKPREGNVSFWLSAFVVACTAVILYYGGFWTGAR